MNESYIYFKCTDYNLFKNVDANNVASGISHIIDIPNKVMFINVGYICRKSSDKFVLLKILKTLFYPLFPALL